MIVVKLNSTFKLDITEYLQPEYLFRAFYNLNSRLNILLQTFHCLSLTFSTNHSKEDDSFPYIRGLIINRAIDVNFNHFSQIRFLILRFPTEKSLDQLNHDTLPYLEHLRVNHMHISVINRVTFFNGKQSPKFKVGHTHH